MASARSLLAGVLTLAGAPLGCSAEDPEALALDVGESEGIDADDEPPPSWRSLVRDDAWRPDSVTDDPIPEHRPALVDCEHGWALEAGGLEIHTGECNYLSLQQPLRAAIEPGAPLRLQLWWQTLASVEPAEGHLALLVDGRPLWEELVPIPGPAATRDLEFESPLGAPVGATLTLHLHNHGYNAWHFHELSVLDTNP